MNATIRDLEDRIRDRINSRRKQHELLSRIADWNRLCSALDVVGEADARRQLVSEAPLDAELGKGRVARDVRRDRLPLGSDAGVDGQLVVDRPCVLEEQPDVVRAGGSQGDEAPGWRGL